MTYLKKKVIKFDLVLALYFLFQESFFGIFTLKWLNIFFISNFKFNFYIKEFFGYYYFLLNLYSFNFDKWFLNKWFTKFDFISFFPFIFLERLKLKSKLLNWDIKFFKKNLKKSVIIYNSFFLKVDFLIAIFFRNYLEYFRRFKYNEYLNEIFENFLTPIDAKKQFVYDLNKIDLFSMFKWNSKKYLFLGKYKLYKFIYRNYNFKFFRIVDNYKLNLFSLFILWMNHYSVIFKYFKYFFLNFFSDYYNFLVYSSILISDQMYKFQRLNITDVNSFSLKLHFSSNFWLKNLFKFYIFKFKKILYYQLKKNSLILSKNLTNTLVSKNLINEKKKLIFIWCCLFIFSFLCRSYI